MTQTAPLSPEAATIRDSIRAITEQSGGVLRVDAIPHDAVGPMLDAARSGDHEAFTKIRRIAALLQLIDTAPRDDPARCASCQQPVSANTPFHITIIGPDCPPPRTAVTIAICQDCAYDVPGIHRAAMALAARVWTGIRPIEISTQTGHA